MAATPVTEPASESTATEAEKPRRTRTRKPETEANAPSAEPIATAVAEVTLPKQATSRRRSGGADSAAETDKPKRARRALADAEGLTATGIAVTGNYNS